MGTAEYANRRYVSLRGPLEDKDRSATLSIRNIDLVVNGICIELIVKNQAGLRTLNHADWRLLAISGAVKGEDCIRKRIRHDDLIVNRVVNDRVHRPSEHRFLSFNSSNCRGVAIRQ